MTFTIAVFKISSELVNHQLLIPYPFLYFQPYYKRHFLGCQCDVGCEKLSTPKSVVDKIGYLYYVNNIELPEV
jgi:hypothetical protein